MLQTATTLAFHGEKKYVLLLELLGVVEQATQQYLDMESNIQSVYTEIGFIPRIVDGETWHV